MSDFTGRVAVVTGAAGALGRAFSLELARRGAAVVVNDLGGNTEGAGQSSALADAVVEEIRAMGGKAIANCDTVGTEAGGEAIVTAAIEAFGRIDAVICNAGNQRNAPFGQMSQDAFEAVVRVHLGGALHTAQPAYRHMVEQGYGRIVLVSSQSGMFGNPIRANYGAAKAGLIGLMNVIAQEAPAGVHVNCLMPNASGSRMGTATPPGGVRPDAAFMAEAIKRGTHYGHRMAPEWTVPMACYLASDACSSSQNIYSVLGGKYSRVFIGLTEGWLAPEGQAPTLEDIATHIGEIDDRRHYAVPLSGIDEMDTAVNAMQRRADSSPE